MAFLITEDLIFWLPNFGICFHFSASLISLLTCIVSGKILRLLEFDGFISIFSF